MNNLSTQKPRVAVLMATYNGTSWLKDQISSILKQKEVNVKIFASDDCSTDDTPLVLQNLAATSSIIILPSAQRFGSAAANFFRLMIDISFEDFDYVFLSDQDDIWQDKKIINAINSMQAMQKDCYASNLTCFYQDGSEKMLRKNYPETENDYLFQSASAGCTYGLSTHAATIVKNVLKENKCNLPQNVSHDWIIYAISRSRGLKWFIDSNSYINYRQHPTNAWGALGIKSYIKRWRLLRNGWYRKNIKLVSSLCILTKKQIFIIQRIERWSLFDRLVLLFSCSTFRRSPVEKIMVATLIIFGLF